MSEPTPIDLPVGLRWVKLVCRLGTLVTDSAADEDAYPDLLPVGGTLTLHAAPSRVRIQEADGRWRSVEVAGRTYTIRGDGELVDNEGRVGVYIPDPASLLVEPQGYAITAEVKPTAGTGWRVTVGGSTVLPDVVDLVAVSSVGPVSPSVTASFDARLDALETGGGGVDVSDATTTTKGILQLAGDLGGTATAPTVPGLAGKADADHDHAIGDVTGLQSALDGKQAAGSYAPASHNHDGTYAPVLGADDNYVTDAEKAALHSHANKAALDAVSGVNTGDQDLSGYATTASLATVATTGAFADLTGAPTIPDSPDDIGAAPATHDHTAADIDSGAATDGHVLTADGAGGAAWEPTAAPATHEALTIDGDATLPSEHQVITLRVSSPATLSIAEAPDGTVVTAHVAYGWEDITWAPEIVVQGETSTTETWLVLVRSEGEWKVLVSGESADSGGGDSGGGSIAGLNVITGQWPPPLPDGEYPDGTLYVRPEEGHGGPTMAVKQGFGGWKALASDTALSEGTFASSEFTPGVGGVVFGGWSFFGDRGSAFMALGVNSTPEPGDILCTFDPGTLTDVQRDCLDGASMEGVLTGMVWSLVSEEPAGVHHVTIDAYDGVIKYLWTVGGAPLASGDEIQLNWPVTIDSEYWETGVTAS